MLSRCTCIALYTAATTAMCLTCTIPANAVVRYGSPDRKYLAPTGEYASIAYGIIGLAPDNTYVNPAWPISPNWALRANHVTANRIGYDIDQNGSPHRVIGAIQVAGTDLELIQVDQPFSSFFNMYNGSDEIGREAVMYGTSGPDKRDKIFSGLTSRFNGWTLGGGGPAVPPGPGEIGSVNWGRNKVSDVVRVGSTDCLHATFDAPLLPDGSVNPDSVGDDESIVYSGDSGGGFFVQQNGQWRLAGITYAVDTFFYSQTDTGTNFGAIVDARGLWTDEDIDPNDPSKGTRRVQIAGNTPVPLGSYFSRVSEYRGSIDSVTGQTAGLGVTVVPEAGSAALALLGSVGALGYQASRRRRRVA